LEPILKATYAANTQVTSDKSRTEIERTVKRDGATRFSYMTDESSATIGFTIKDRSIRFVLPLPDYNDDDFRLTANKQYLRSDSAHDELYEKAVRQKWRALALVIKAKLESIEVNISTLEQESYANTVLPNNQTIYEYTHLQFGMAIAQNDMKALTSSARFVC
jgi:hypothetical protein